MSSNVNALKIDAKDNVAVALRNLKKGELLKVHGEVEGIEVLSDIPYGHKVSLDYIRKEERIIKYGESMGMAKESIRKGEHVHEFNVQGLHDIDKKSIRRGAVN